MRDGAAPDPDLLLVRRAGAGDGEACAALVNRHLARIHALGVRLLGNRAEAEEVAQETFLRAWRQAPVWREGEARFSAWLHRVAVNLCRDRLRRRRETPLEEAGDMASDAAPPGVTLQERSVAVRVAAALGRLPERQREALVLCYYQEMSNKEAAAVMGIGVEALESLLARGRRRLKEMLIDEAADLLGDLS